MHIHLGGHDIGGHLDEHGARAAGVHLVEGLGDHGGRVFRRLDPLLPFGNRRHGARLILHLMEEPEALVDGAARDLAGDAQHLGAEAVA